MALPSGFIKIPVILLIAEAPALMDISIFMPLNQKTVLYRRAGDMLSLEDVLHLRKNASSAIMKQEDYEPAMKRLAGTLTHATDTAASQELVQDILTTMTRDPDAPAEIKKAELDAAADLVKTVLTSTAQPRTTTFYEKILSDLDGDDPFSTHNRHVGALAALIMMALGGFSTEDVADIAFAGFFHDAYLKDLPEKIADLHLRGEDLGTLVSKAPTLNVFNHITKLLERFDAEKVPAPASALRSISQHHENFDGSGLRGTRGESISKPARILRIADDMVCLFNSPRKKQSLASAYASLENFNQKMETPIYDPDILAKLEPIFG